MGRIFFKKIQKPKKFTELKKIREFHLKERTKMTLKEFVKVWKKCKNNDELNKLNDELREKYGVDMFEFDEIEREVKDLKWQEPWHFMIFDYFLDELHSINYNALIIDERFKLGNSKFKEKKRQCR